MSIHFAVLTVSDRSSKGEYEDRSGPLLVEAVKNSGWEVLKAEVVPDDFDQIVNKLSVWADSGDFNVILTTGGTGFTSRDVTPEATSKVIEREAPGLAEAMRAGSLLVTPHAMLSRGVAGIRKRTLIINLPGSPKAALENYQIVVPVLTHAVQMLKDDSSAEEGHRRTVAI